jgi:hypothetical protein
MSHTNTVPKSPCVNTISNFISHVKYDTIPDQIIEPIPFTNPLTNYLHPQLTSYYHFVDTTS